MEANPTRAALARELRQAATRLDDLAVAVEKLGDQTRAFDVLGELVDTAQRVDLTVADLVALSRDERLLTWAQIGTVFGISRQAAHERFDGKHQQRWISTIRDRAEN